MVQRVQEVRKRPRGANRSRSGGDEGPPDFFERRVEEVIERLPKRFRDASRNVQFIIEDEPDPDLLEDDEGHDDEGPLLGLYVGTPLPDRTYGDVPALPDRIYIFRGPLERSCRSRRELSEQIRITVLHELAHYFGFDDDYLLDVGYD